MKQGFILLLLLTSYCTQAQTLKPHIGVQNLPSDESAICEIPWYLESFNSSGYSVGDTVNDFSLYTPYETKYTLSNLLETKPVLLISSSYSCPVFRNKLDAINELNDSFGNDVHIIVVYTVEAHPQVDTSPYFGFVNPGSQNNNQGILYRQPTTYGERKAIVNEMLDEETIDVPILIDGPCNSWWTHFGPAPNNATLIDTDGTVYAKHAWFNKYPEDMSCELNQVLGRTSPCNTDSIAGVFNFTMTSSDTIIGMVNSVITFDAEIDNISTSDVLVFVKRLQNNLPDDWEGSLCIDVCYATDVDSTTVLVPANTSQHFSFYFYTSSTENFGNVRVGFLNLNYGSNSFIQNLYGETKLVNSVQNVEEEPMLYPNPLRGDMLTVNNLVNYTVRAFNAQGKEEQLLFTGNAIDCSHLSNGVWFLKFHSNKTGKSFSSKVVVLK
jgi:hypothetical protein